VGGDEGLKKNNIKKFVDDSIQAMKEVKNYYIFLFVFFAVCLIFLPQIAAKIHHGMPQQILPLYSYWISIFTMIITFFYFLATLRIANKTAESVEASRNFSDTTIKIEKDRLTYELIKEWSYDKKLLTLKRQKIGENFLNAGSKKFNFKKSIEFIGHFNGFFDYFTIVHELIKNDKINKELYLKVLSKQIIDFMKREYRTNIELLHIIQNKFHEEAIDFPVTSTFDGLREVVWLVEEEIKPGTHENYF
jgi:hypothetical protein